MASEAQRLIGISLTKIAQSRTHRGGVSLHKNLLVATVLQKARYIFMEEAYNMVHYQQQPPTGAAPVQVQVQQQQVTGQHHQSEDNEHEHEDDEERVGLTVEEAGIQDYQGCIKCANQQQIQQKHNKENHPPSQELTYLDLDSDKTRTEKEKNVLKEQRQHTLKRRRAVSEWETEEAVQSILPKRKCSNSTTAITPGTSLESDDDNVFLDDATTLSETVSKELELEKEKQKDEQPNNAMEIDRITSLVSIFSFGMTAGESKLGSRVTTPDLCSSQAKEGDNSIQQRPFLAMTV